MNYIYDILLNFQNEYYDFYNWNNDDKVCHIKKTPIIKVSDKVFLDIKYNSITFDSCFLDTIYNKTQVFKKYDICTLKYACIICSNKDAMGIKLSKNGCVVGKSSLLLEECDEVLEITSNNVTRDVHYLVNSNLEKNDFKTRAQILQSKFIIKSLTNMFKNKEYDKLKYLYYECFSIKNNNINNVFNSLLKEVSKYSDNYYRINDFLKIINQK